MLSKKLNYSEFEEQAVVGTISNWPQTELASVEFDDASWSTKRDLTVPGIYEAVVEQQTPVLCGFQETNNVSDHFNTGVTYTRYLGIKTSATDYGTFLSSCVPSQKEWITWLHKDMEGKVIVVVSFANEMAGGVLEAAYDYLCDHIPMAIKEDRVPRLLMSSGDSMWLGGTVNISTCNHIRSSVATGPNKVNPLVSKTEKLEIYSKYRAIYPVVKLDEAFDPKTDSISGLVNHKNPIRKPEDKKNVNSKYWHGGRSKNWVEFNLLLGEICDGLLKGFHYFPSLTTQGFDEKGQKLSRRKKTAFVGTHAILLDVDEWEHWDREPPKDIQDFLDNYIPKNFPKPTFIMETPNSNTEKYPYPRYRVIYATSSMLDVKQTEIIGQYLMDNVPGCPKDVGFNIMRCGYGNARPECESYRNFDNIISNEFLNLVLNEHRNRKIKEIAIEDIKNLEASRDTRDIVENHSKKTHKEFNRDFYKEVDFRKWINDQGHVFISKTSEGWEQYKRAGKEDEGISFGIVQTSEGFVIVVFSTTMSAPVHGQGMSGFRYYTWVEEGIDIKNTSPDKNREVFSRYEVQKEEEEYRDIWKKYTLKQKFQNKKILKRDYYTECVQELKDLEQQFKVIVLTAPPDSGKTTLQAELADSLDLSSISLHITPRKTLCNNGANSISNYVFNSLSPEEQELYEDNAADFVHGDVIENENWTAPTHLLSTTINSFKRASDMLKKASINKIRLHWDEIDFIIKSLLGHQLKGSAYKLIQKIKRMMALGGTTYITGATATNSSIKKFLDIMGIQEEEIVECILEKPDPKDLPDFFCFEINNSKNLVEILANRIDKYHRNKRLFIASASKEIVKSLANHELIKKRGALGIITGENSQKEEVSEWLQCKTLEEMGLQTLIVSPSVDVGVDLKGPETQIITIRNSTRGGSIATTFQQARRVRDSKYPIEHYTVNPSKMSGYPLKTEQEYIYIEEQKAKQEYIYKEYGCPVPALQNDVHYQIKIQKNKEKIEELNKKSLEDLLEEGVIPFEYEEYYRQKQKIAALEGAERYRDDLMSLNEKSFLLYHCEEEGRRFIEVPLDPEDLPNKEQLKIATKRDKARKQKEETEIFEKIVANIKNREVLSINDIEETRQKKGFKSYVEYKAAIETNKVVTTFGPSNKAIEKNLDNLPEQVWSIVDKETEKRYVKDPIKEEEEEQIVEKNLSLALYNKKKKIYDFKNNPEPIKNSEKRRIGKILASWTITELKVNILDFLEKEFTELGRCHIDTLYEQSLEIANKQIALLNNRDGSICYHTVSDAIFVQFSDDGMLKTYKKNRKKHGQGASLFFLFRKLLRDYLSLNFVSVGKGGKQRVLQPDENREDLYKQFDNILDIKDISEKQQPDIPKEQVIEPTVKEVIETHVEQPRKEVMTWKQWEAKEAHDLQEERLAIMEESNEIGNQ